MEAPRCAYKRNIILNSVCQHNHFITQGNYKATCFNYRLVIFSCQLSHKMLCTLWDPKVCIASCDSIDKNRPEDD